MSMIACSLSFTRPVKSQLNLHSLRNELSELQARLELVRTEFASAPKAVKMETAALTEVPVLDKVCSYNAFGQLLIAQSITHVSYRHTVHLG